MLRHLVRTLAARGKAILYSSHILEVVERVCDKVIVLHKGDVVADDSIERLRTLLSQQFARGRVLAARHPRRSRNSWRAIWRTSRRWVRNVDAARLRTPYVLLTKQFLRQFLENDLISPDADRSQLLAVVGALVDVADAVHQRVHVGRATSVPLMTPGQAAVLSLDDKFFYLALAMIVTALVAASQWDVAGDRPARRGDSRAAAGAAGNDPARQGVGGRDPRRRPSRWPSTCSRASSSRGCWCSTSGR